MNSRVAYRRAFEILVAFHGMDIIVEEKGKGTKKSCFVGCSTLSSENKIRCSPIIERPSWQEVLLDLLPPELIPDRKNPPFNEVGYVSQVYQFRHIGIAIKRDSRERLFRDRAKAEDS